MAFVATSTAEGLVLLGPGWGSSMTTPLAELDRTSFLTQARTARPWSKHAERLPGPTHLTMCCVALYSPRSRPISATHSSRL